MRSIILILKSFLRLREDLNSQIKSYEEREALFWETVK
jgi:hypothetical protein